jgi:ribulose 1,5-bisphosphate carboxylase large subunit-like protein
MGHSAYKARERLSRLTYQEWEDRVDELTSLAGFRVREVTGEKLMEMYARRLSAGLTAELLIEVRNAAGK